jgi:hypothetical protein
MKDTASVVFWVVIKVWDRGMRTGVDKPRVLRWDNLPWAVRTKWDWYFKYRAALEQVCTPRAHIDFTWGHSEPDQRTADRILADRISRQQAKVTKIKNLLFKARAEWNDLMPIEDHPTYKRAMEKLQAEQAEYNALRAQITATGA